MHYYPFHIGDYSIDTRHLDPMHDLAYRRLLDLYYLSERPIPLGTQQVSRRLGLAQDVVQSVLQEFFAEREDGWHQARCDSEILAFNKRASTSRANGQKAKRHKKASRNPAGTHQVADGMPADPREVPTLVMVTGFGSSSLDTNEEPLPAGFPKNEKQAFEMAQNAGCPAPIAYITDIWQQAASRGGRDGAKIIISRWGLYAKKRWGREEMEWSASQKKVEPAHIPPEDRKWVIDEDYPEFTILDTIRICEERAAAELAEQRRHQDECEAESRKMAGEASQQ